MTGPGVDRVSVSRRAASVESTCLDNSTGGACLRQTELPAHAETGWKAVERRRSTIGQPSGRSIAGEQSAGCVSMVSSDLNRPRALLGNERAHCTERLLTPWRACLQAAHREAREQ